MPEHEMVPEIRITDALVAPSAVVSALALVTVVVGALPPPVVPPFWVAQPTRPVCGGPGGPVLVGGGWLLELDVVGGGVEARHFHQPQPAAFVRPKRKKKQPVA